MRHTILLFIVLLSMLWLVQSFKQNLQRWNGRHFSKNMIRKGAAAMIPQEISSLQPVNDMILVERVSESARTPSGLHVVRNENSDARMLATVLAISPTLAETQEYKSAPIHVGDTILLRDMWGVGPKDIEVKSRRFSFHKHSRVVAIVKNTAD